MFTVVNVILFLLTPQPLQPFVILLILS